MEILPQASNMIGSHLKQVHVNFVLDEKISPRQAKKFLREVVNTIGLKIVFLKVTKLPPSFDIVGGLKESCIYFGYWSEVNFVSVYISSCRRFEERNIPAIVRRSFLTEGRVDVSVIKDLSVMQEVRSLV